MKKIMVIEAPSNLGLIEPFSGGEPGVKKLPAWLKKHGLYKCLHPYKIKKINPPPYTMMVDIESGVRNADSIVDFSGALSVAVQRAIMQGYFTLVIGGDCSILIGCAIALKKIGRFGLFFLDGHTDYMWPELSQTAGAAGMELAIVCGIGSDKLTNISDLKPYFEEKYVWCVGNRDDTDWYVHAIKNSGIHYVDLHNLRKAGIYNCVTDFLQFVREEELVGFWVHVDVDVLNDNLMPAVDSRQPDGLLYEEFYEILYPLVTHEKAIGLNLTILDPDRDTCGVHTKTFINQFCSVLKSLHQ